MPKSPQLRVVYSVAAVLLATALCAGASVNYSYDPTGRLARVDFPNGKSILYTYDPAGNILNRVVFDASSGAAPLITAAGVVNAGSYAGGSVAPGEIVTIFGTGIGPAQPAGAAISGGAFSKFVADTVVLFDGIASPVIAVSSGQTSVIVPYSVAGKSSTQMQVYFQGRASNVIQLAVAASAPGLFSANASGTGNGAILNQDNSINSPSSPAPQGSVIVLFGTGEGQTKPAGVDGQIASSVFPAPLLPVTVTIGGQNATVLYSGAAPGLVAGVLQVNAALPQDLPSGPVPVVVKVGNASSQSGLMVSVQ